MSLRVFTWHVHGSYLLYLSQGNYTLYIPVNKDRSNRNIGRGEGFPFPSNVVEVPVEKIPDLEFDCILFQNADNYRTDQWEILTEKQRALPKIYVEHDPPREHPTDMPHYADDPGVLVVHVTHFNRLMWHNGSNPTTVIEHGVIDKRVNYKGNLERGIVVINDLPSRGRRLGFDIFNEVRKEIPLDLIGMNTGEMGLGEVLHKDLPEFISQYRFFLNPIRYTSFGLAVIESMLTGVPVVGLATTEMAAVFKNGENSLVDTNVGKLIDGMKRLLKNKDEAAALGQRGRETAVSRFNIARFTSEWEQVFRSVTKKKAHETTNRIYQ